MDFLLEYIRDNVAEIVPLILSIGIVALIMTVVIAGIIWKLYSGMKEYRQILEDFGESGASEQLSILLRQVSDFSRRMDAAENHKTRQDILQKELSDQLQTAVQNVGLLRYNAFTDVAGDQSYSLALLSQHGDGVVLTTLHGRSESRTYAKKVVAGVSSYPLLPEEQQAITLAMQNARSSSIATVEKQDAVRESVPGSSSPDRAYLLGRREEMVAYASAEAQTAPRRERPLATSSLLSIPQVFVEEAATEKKADDLPLPEPVEARVEVSARVSTGLDFGESVKVIRDSSKPQTAVAAPVEETRAASTASHIERDTPPPWVTATKPKQG